MLSQKLETDDSGMPLLDKLKGSLGTTPLPWSSTSPSAQEWLSLSAALGLDLDPRLHAIEVGDDEQWHPCLSVVPPDLVDM